jgi:hypothetical protein
MFTLTMISLLRKQFVKELYVYNTKYNLCGRDMCFCLHKLDMDKKEEYEYYKQCYDSWNLFSKILNPVKY